MIRSCLEMSSITLREVVLSPVSSFVPYSSSTLRKEILSSLCTVKITPELELT